MGGIVARVYCTQCYREFTLHYTSVEDLETALDQRGNCLDHVFLQDDGRTHTNARKRWELRSVKHLTR